MRLAAIHLHINMHASRQRITKHYTYARQAAPACSAAPRFTYNYAARARPIKRGLAAHAALTLRQPNRNVLQLNSMHMVLFQKALN